MGLLGTLEQQIGGGALGQLQGHQQGALLGALSALIANSGGLSGLIKKFQQNGLGEHVQSWIGHGENKPLTAQHVNQVFGADQIQQVAQQTGTQPAQASGLIAGILPQIVNKLTPQGQPVSDSEAHHGLSSLVSGGLGSLLNSK
ncbi:MAG TPA: YidB family protein [Candidatus Dormibacteraeota bacterium]|nr:YidB family protein [Candidatus Dormibacteraeota bacterium]